ncbi:Chemotaxis protein [Pseudomonas savastanoi pv. glycinea]|nr:Chemotaxis protein [Pseudomonas savastanoi pv. glycinea]
MKLVFREYLASLRERRELDVVLPDLLSELGYTIISRPSVGTRQYGVDIAALGPKTEQERKVYLFSLKQGDLNRADWDGTAQALRSSIDEILDVYIPNRISTQHEEKKIVICLCFGGEILEALRDNITGFIRRHTTERVSFQEWNGDHIAGLLSEGILREPLVGKSVRSSFQKAIAMVDEPEISFLHFSALIQGLLASPAQTPQERAGILRQIYICLWVMFVWARDADNLESSYKASELAILQAWQLIRGDIDGKGNLAIRLTFAELTDLHFNIGDTFFEKKITPFVEAKHALSVAVLSANAADVNLKLFEILGRISLRGLWVLWGLGGDDVVPKPCFPPAPDEARRIANTIIHLIDNNPCLLSPIADEQSIDIGIALLFLAMMEEYRGAAGDYTDHLISRITFAFISHGQYPTIHREYRTLIEHPREATEEYRKTETKASTLLPLLSIWASALERLRASESLADFSRKYLKHCNHQFWLIGIDSEERLYKGDLQHGICLTNIPITTDGVAAMNILDTECKGENQTAFSSLSAIKLGHWPIIIMACRHYRLPLPPNLWLDLLKSGRKDSQ